MRGRPPGASTEAGTEAGTEEGMEAGTETPSTADLVQLYSIYEKTGSTTKTRKITLVQDFFGSNFSASMDFLMSLR